MWTATTTTWPLERLEWQRRTGEEPRRRDVQLARSPGAKRGGCDVEDRTFQAHDDDGDPLHDERRTCSIGGDTRNGGRRWRRTTPAERLGPPASSRSIPSTCSRTRSMARNPGNDGAEVTRKEMTASASTKLTHADANGALDNTTGTQPLPCSRALDPCHRGAVRRARRREPGMLCEDSDNAYWNGHDAQRRSLDDYGKSPARPLSWNEWGRTASTRRVLTTPERTTTRCGMIEECSRTR